MNTRASSQTLAVIGLIALALSCSSCGLTRVLGGEEYDCQNIATAVTEFHQKVTGGDVDGASGYVTLPKQTEFRSYANQQLSKQKFINVEIDTIHHSPRSDQAYVDVKIKYFKVPSYIVRTRVERQVWRYDETANNWVFHAITEEQLL